MFTVCMIVIAWALFAVNLVICPPIAVVLWLLYGLLAGVILVGKARRWVTALGTALFILPVDILLGLISYTTVMAALEDVK